MMMTETDELPLVTIQCITYNHEAFIRQCLEGFVMQQTNFRFEAVVHDDASTDGTADIVREFAAKYPDIIKPIYETENQYSKHDGQLSRIMHQHTRGKYVALCEGDDYWTDPLKLQKQADFLEKNEEYSIVGNKVYIDNYGKSLEKEISNVQNPILAENTIGRLPFHTCTFMYRKENLDASLTEELCKEFMAGDRIKMALLLLKGKGHLIDEYMAVYRNHKGGITKNLTKKFVAQNGIKMLKKLNQIAQYKYKNHIYNCIIYGRYLFSNYLLRRKQYFRYFIGLFVAITDVKNIPTLKFYIKNIVFRREI